MKKITRWLNDIFDPEDIQNLDIAGIALAFNDPAIRTVWLQSILADIKRLNLEVDKKILDGERPQDLSIRRQTLQYVLESVLSARRRVKQDERLNPGNQMVNLDRVTA